MINFISSWAEQLSVAVIVAVLIEMIIPNNKNKKYINMVIGIYVLFNIISPFIESNDVLSFENIDINEYVNTQTDTTINQTSMDLRLKELYIEELEKDVTSKVEENGYVVTDCIVEANLDENAEDKGINKIEVTISGKKKNNEIEDINEVQEIKIGISNSSSVENKKDISNEELENLQKELSEYYQVNQNIITVYY